jgi:hypothetical protein
MWGRMEKLIYVVGACYAVAWGLAFVLWVMDEMAKDSLIAVTVIFFLSYFLFVVWVYFRASLMDSKNG